MTTAERYERYRFLLWIAFGSIFIVAVAHAEVTTATLQWTAPPYPPIGTVFVIDTGFRQYECSVAANHACVWTFNPPLGNSGGGCLRAKSDPPAKCQGVYWNKFNVSGGDQPKPKRRAVGGKK